MRLLLVSLAVALALFPPYLSLYHDIHFSFSGFVMVPVMALHFVAMMAHETGHTLTRWLFGYPAFPSFDTEISLGLTRVGPRSFLILGVIWASLAAGIFYLWSKKRARQALLLSGLALTHVFLALSPAHEILNFYMGHGMEIIVSFACLTLALRGMKKFHSFWRAALMSAALYVMLKTVLMCLELMFIRQPRGFGLMKNGQYMSDFLRIQNLTGFSLPMAAVPLLVFTLLFLAEVFMFARRLERLPVEKNNNII